VRSKYTLALRWKYSFNKKNIEIVKKLFLKIDEFGKNGV
jgi:hypothetical protein